MTRKTMVELETELEKLRAKEQKLKEELSLKKKEANAKNKKEMTKKKIMLANLFVDQFGIAVLNCRDELEFYIAMHVEEIMNILTAYGKQE